MVICLWIQPNGASVQRDFSNPCSEVAVCRQHAFRRLGLPADSGIAENGAMRNRASPPPVRPSAREVDSRRVECQVTGVEIDRCKPDSSCQRAGASDGQAIAAWLEREPMWIFIRRQKNATDFARMFRIV